MWVRISISKADRNFHALQMARLGNNDDDGFDSQPADDIGDNDDDDGFDAHSQSASAGQSVSQPA